MKKLFSILVALFATINLFANVQGHFFLNVESENVQVAQAQSHFAQWLDLPANTTFTLFRDTTDNIGIRHLSYQQFVNGTEVANSMILVHAKNNVVFAVNGDIMEVSSTAQQVHRKITAKEAISKVRKKANSTAAPLKIVRATIDGEMIYRYAYEVLADDATCKQYVDAETGDIITSVPLVFNADVEGTAMTMYYGTQPITCFEDNGTYYLRDTERGIITLNATDNYDPDDEYKLEHIYNLPDPTPEILNYLNTCAEITNLSTTWGGYWMILLESVKIEGVAQNSNWYSIGEGTADVYIKIKDGSGNVKFTSSRYDDPTFPITFDIGMQITTPPYYIEVWDYDPIGSDDLIETITIESIRGEKKTYGELDVYSRIVDLSYTTAPLGRQPFLDAHWGMEKTIDFYREKFNRNSYDNNGAAVYQLLNHPSTFLGLLGGMHANACAIGNPSPCLMFYGMGEISSTSSDMISSTNPFVAIDIMAHEFSHLVTEKNGNGGLIYKGESGALNESFSDIMGISVKKYATGSNNWLLGDEIMVYVSNMRSMINPNNGYDGSKPQPDTYNGQYWADPTDYTDNGGVHTNSGVQNYWYYLLCEGGSGTNDLSNAYNVIGIGMDKALQIAYRNLIFYLTPEATFEDARNGSIQAAIDLYGKDTQEHQSVVNAWYAVGVGDKYTTGKEEASEYYIVAKRSSGNYYFFTPEKVSGKNRLVAVDAGTSIRTSIDTINTTSDYLWTFEGNKLKNHNGQYLSCTSAKSAVMNDTGIELVKTDNSDGTVTFMHAASETETWYFSLALAGNDYFVFYANANQITHLLMLPKGNNSTTPVTNTEVTPQATKILRNGQIFIQRGDKVYTIQGQVVE